MGVLLVDLDDFKLVNDTMGHGTGDELLVAVAGRLTAALRPDDVAARLGGDEFAILIQGAANATEIEEIAARVVDALAAPLDVVAGMTTSVSVGVATTPGARSSAEMLSQADLALYAAKGAGKGRWRRYEPGLHLAAVDRLEVRTELEHAIASGAFTLRYQPIVELCSGALVGVEALVRWRHPRRGLVPPGDFIHVAEETGLVVPLGSWVLDCALSRPRPLAPEGRAGDVGHHERERLGPPGARPGLPGHAGRRRSPGGTCRRSRSCWRSRRRRCSARTTGSPRTCPPCASSACASPSTTSAPATRRWTTSGATPSTS